MRLSSFRELLFLFMTQVACIHIGFHHHGLIFSAGYLLKVRFTFQLTDQSDVSLTVTLFMVEGGPDMPLHVGSGEGAL